MTTSSDCNHSLPLLDLNNDVIPTGVVFYPTALKKRVFMEWDAISITL